MPASGLMHTAGVKSGNVHDAKVMDRLIRDDDAAVYRDKATPAKRRSAPRGQRACSGPTLGVHVCRACVAALRTCAIIFADGCGRSGDT